MSGYGITKNYQVGMLFADYKLWRETSFCHQLSMNGSLLLAHNHDPLWYKMLCQTIAWPSESEWSKTRMMLRAMPGYQARKALWQASYLWFGTSLRQYTEIAKIAAQSEILEDWLFSYESKNMMRTLEMRARQLEDLRWCLERFEGDEEEIQVIEKLPQRQKPRKALPSAASARTKNPKQISEKAVEKLQ